METQSRRNPHPLMWIGGISLIVFFAAGVAALLGWIPTSLGKAGGLAPVVVTTICLECGVIKSVVESERSYDITVRFDNGSSRVISESRAQGWRAGDKVRVVSGVIHSNA